MVGVENTRLGGVACEFVSIARTVDGALGLVLSNEGRGGGGMSLPCRDRVLYSDNTGLVGRLGLLSRLIGFIAPRVLLAISWSLRLLTTAWCCGGGSKTL